MSSIGLPDSRRSGSRLALRSLPAIPLAFHMRDVQGSPLARRVVPTSGPGNGLSWQSAGIEMGSMRQGIRLAGIAAGLALSQLWPLSPALAQKQDASRAQPSQLAPHRAIYEFTLGRVRSEKGITALTGRMVYEFTGSACEGYSQSMRFVTRTSAASGVVNVSDQRSTTWEDETGTRYRFQSSQFRDQKLIDQTAGTATRKGAGEDTRVELSRPKPRNTAIGGGALFPVQHSLRMLETARRGRTNFTADFFDGSEGGEKTYVVSAQVGKAVVASFNRTLPRVGQADKLDGMQAWPVMLSYFEQGTEKQDAVPVYEMGFVLFANGVSRRIVIDNGEYTMRGELSDLTMLDPLPCKR